MLVYYYWRTVLRQQRHSFKDTSLYFQLYYTYFYLNLFKDNIVNSETKDRKEMEARNGWDSRQWQEMARVLTVHPVLFQMIFTEELDKVQKAK